jgi:hypothetical protein
LRLQTRNQVLEVLLGYLLPFGDIFEVNEALVGV